MRRLMILMEGGGIRRNIRVIGVRGRVVRKCYMHDGTWRLGSQVRARVMASYGLVYIQEAEIV